MMVSNFALIYSAQRVQKKKSKLETIVSKDIKKN